MLGKRNRKVWDAMSSHHDNVCECFNYFEKFFAEYLQNNKAEYETTFKKIVEYENLADIERREMVKTFLECSLLPSTRKELLKIVKMNDEIANVCEHIANQLVLEEVRLPEYLDSGLTEIISITKQQIAALTRAQELLFGNFEKLLTDAYILQEIRDYEHDIDAIHNRLLKVIYHEGQDLSAKWHARYFLNKITDLSDNIEDIADEIEIMAVLRKV